MFESFLITSRETLEASLVVGIVLAYLNKTNNRQYRKSVYYGILFGILGSILAAWLFILFTGGFEGKSEALFEAITMLFGAFLLTTMILWLMRQRHIVRQIEARVQRHVEQPKPLFSHFGIFLLIMVAILREGVETVIFLNAINFASGISFLSATLGIIVAVVAGYLFFASSKKVNLKNLFTISSVLLILFAAGLVAHGVHELEEAAVIPAVAYPLYDVNDIFSEKGTLGSFFKGLFGYNGNPSLTETLAYLSYLVLLFFLYRRIEYANAAQNNNA